ncbi:tetratricopeptide repeat-containing sulfotransferase family protein [Rhodanobacter sp. C05]|uniref:tetratricopeptide repeat-containing sulfotransferase family protein n=1 Tax=Rhodanobacter sp. C05 TaxID=1945855 RepID=UPI0009CBD735|nr:tetratricopeptide repeat-containing sulfotransferase family protein [Rhodanobacter sp. C05]OOG43389.1 hypothetical protein B0E51_00820 [Rhodanobacter sp. C05]
MIDHTRQRHQLLHAFNQRDWQQVHALAVALLGFFPYDADVHFIAGLAELERGQLGPALQLLRHAFSLDQQRPEFSANLARALSMAGARHEAMVMAELAMGSKPIGPATLDILGTVYSNLNAHDAALDAFRQAAALAPDHAPFRYNLATSLIDAGALDEAEREIDACLSLNPHFWRAHLTLAHLQQQTPVTQHLARLESLLAEPLLCTEARASLHLALAKEHEDLGNYAESFDHLTAGKKAAREGIQYSIKQDEAVFAALERATPSPGNVHGHQSSEPIFVFGMPRTGTTLVERILSRHPEIRSAGELPDFSIALRQVWGNDRPLGSGLAAIDGIGEIDWRRVGELYLSRARSAAGTVGRETHFIDKLPHNFLYAGFIAKTFPKAKLICLRRNPIDTCLSNFRQLFARKLPYYNYSFDLLDTGAYYVMFNRLMAHWRQVFPGRILEISYETLVSQQRVTSRQILEFCGLQWNELCMDFHENTLPVATASAVQVRSKMYTTAVQRWHRYRPQLAELCTLLEQAGISVE